MLRPIYDKEATPLSNLSICYDTMILATVYPNLKYLSLDSDVVYFTLLYMFLQLLYNYNFLLRVVVVLTQRHWFLHLRWQRPSLKNFTGPRTIFFGQVFHFHRLNYPTRGSKDYLVDKLFLQDEHKEIITHQAKIIIKNI